MELVFHVRVLAAHIDAGFQLAKKCHRVYSYPTFNKAPVKCEFYIFIIFIKELKGHIRNVKKLKKTIVLNYLAHFRKDTQHKTLQCISGHATFSHNGRKTLCLHPPVMKKQQFKPNLILLPL